MKNHIDNFEKYEYSKPTYQLFTRPRRNEEHFGTFLLLFSVYLTFPTESPNAALKTNLPL